MKLNIPVNIPNVITVLRILVTPLFIILVQRDAYLAALLVFSFAGISDGLDGFLARYLNQRTRLGATLDPIADKILLMSAYILLALKGILPSWLTVIAISRDLLIIIGMAILTFTRVKVEINPSLISKFTTAAQLGAVFLTLLDPHPVQAFTFRSWVYWVTAVTTVVSGLHYVYIGLGILQNALESE
ncbi:MAG: CDP-diacylglycerol--glycerol-3-phosphate 3-phosphatidyltransferase [Desulfobacterales bacterium]